MKSALFFISLTHIFGTFIVQKLHKYNGIIEFWTKIGVQIPRFRVLGS